MKSIYLTVLFCLLGLLHAQTAINYMCDTTVLTGYYALAQKTVKPHTGKPGVIILPAWMGITDHEKETVKRLSQLGYITLAADVYGSKVKPSNFQEAAKLSGFYKKNYQLYQARIKAAIEQLINLGADPDKIVVIGYCFGGTGAIEAARGRLPVRGVVSFHGGLAKDSLRTVEPMVTELLILHGAEDPYVPAKEVSTFLNEMRVANADWQMISYSKAVHAFTDPAAGNDPMKGAAYNKRADVLSWQALINFLERVLSTGNF